MAQEVLPSDVAKNERGLTMLGKVPLYRNASIPSSLDTGNAGLYFNKFCPVLDPEAKGAKSTWLKDFLKSASVVGDRHLIAEHLARREQLIDKLGGHSLRIKTAARFVTGLGYRHQLENGFAWHAVLGTPYLPGSGLKGLTRTWATLCGVSDDDIHKIFGPRGENVEHQVGSVIFWDAIPCEPVKLVAEVMTPHYGPYYQGTEPPADYHDPNPIPFLAVEKGVSFLTGVLPRTPSDVDAAQKALQWLRDALTELGAGAKTATGYGRFDVEGGSAAKETNAVVVTTSKPAEPIKAPEPTTLPAFFEVEFIDFGEAREARKTAQKRAKDGKEPKFREFELRPTDPGLVKLAGKLVCSARDTEGFDLPFERAVREKGSRPFYVEQIEEREGKKVARVILLTAPDENGTVATMKVTRVDFEEFSAFKSARIDACAGINVFLGPNGSGKSHAMKAMYALIKTMEKAHSTVPLEARLREKLAKVFRPDDGFLGRLVRRTPDRSIGSIRVEGTSGDIGVKLHTDGDIALNVTSSSWETFKSTIFIPASDLLAMYEGFIATYQSREVSFDETYHDACLALQSGTLRGQDLNHARELVKPIEDAIGGQVVLKSNRFYLKRSDGEMEAHLLAEGYRKLASVVQLIMNGSLTANGILFWDEPEANLNPRLVSVVVDVLLGLAKRGVQIFVTTHDYLLSHKLSLVSEYGTHPDVPIRFFAFHRKSEQDPVEVSPGDTLADLPDDPILDEFAKHYDFKRALFMGATKMSNT